MEGRGALAFLVELIADGRGRIRARGAEPGLRAPLPLHEIGGPALAVAGIGRQLDRLDRRLRGLLVLVLLILRILVRILLLVGLLLILILLVLILLVLLILILLILLLLVFGRLLILRLVLVRVGLGALLVLIFRRRAGHRGVGFRRRIRIDRAVGRYNGAVGGAADRAIGRTGAG